LLLGARLFDGPLEELGQALGAEVSKSAVGRVA
jgi:hypothetical protein